MEFRILGPLDVVENGTQLAIGAYKQRALLAVLLIHRGTVVSADALVDALWGDAPPATAAKSVQIYVSHLRKVLGDDLLATRGKGYVLQVDPEAVDAARFEHMLERGRRLLADGESRAAAAILATALALWRGPALADFAYDTFAQGEIARLEELRLAAVEERVEADLALGRHTQLVPELEGLVGRHPLRERMRGQLMLALYGAGRQAEALDAYQQARRALMDELGIEPGPGLREIEAAVLRQDADLFSSPRRSAHARRRRGGLLIALGGGALLAAAVAAAIVALGDDGGSPSVAGVRPLPASFCSPLLYGSGTRPHLLIVSDQGLRGSDAEVGNQIAAAVEGVLRDHGLQAGRHAVAYQACDDSNTDESGAPVQCASNARAYADNPSVVGIVGPTLSRCAKEQIPIVNRARGGPVAMISASNTAVGLTRDGIGAEPEEPSVYYPRGIRNYVRLMPADDFQAAANAMLARRLGVHGAFVLYSGSAALADAFRGAATKLAIDVVGQHEWRFDSTSYANLARLVRRSGADAVFLAGPLANHGARLVRDLRAGVGEDVRFLAPDGFAVPDELEAIGTAAEGMTVSISGIAPAALRGAGKRYVMSLEHALGEAPDQFAVYAAQATELLLDAIARSDGSRASVVRQLFASRVRGGILGDFDVTDTGDTTANDVTIYRVRHGRMKLVRVITPPVSLVVRDR